MDDAELVRQALGGDGEAYTQLAHRWAAWVVALCHARSGRADAAADLALEALLRGYEELPALADPGRFGPWLADIVRHVCREWLATARVNGTSHGEGRKAVVATEAAGAAILRQAEAIPEEERVALMPFYYQKAGYRDLALLLDVPTATVRDRVAKARGALLGAGACKPPSAPAPSCVLVDTLISARLDGELDAADREMIDQHVTGCSCCAATLDAWTALDGQLRSAFASLQPVVAATVSRAQARLGSKHLRRCSVLVVDDEEYVLTTLVKLLSADYDVVAASDVDAAEQILASRAIDILLTDQRMPRREGILLLEWAKENTPRTVRLLMTGYSELDDAVEAINRGHVYHYLLKPWRTEDLLQVVRNAADKFLLERKRERYLDELWELNRELERRVGARTRELEETNQLLQQKARELERLALTDSLTGLFNRRAMEELAKFELKRHARYPSPLAVGYIDVDHFKAINTRFLHTGGDEVLRSLARLLAGAVREVDSVGRIGGEEFLVIARETGTEGARVLAERLRSRVASTPIAYQSQPVGVTVSVGFAVAEVGVPADQTVMSELAAKALALAKERGRNRCEILSLPPDSK